MAKICLLVLKYLFADLFVERSFSFKNFNQNPRGRSFETPAMHPLKQDSNQLTCLSQFSNILLRASRRHASANPELNIVKVLRLFDELNKRLIDVFFGFVFVFHDRRETVCNTIDIS